MENKNQHNEETAKIMNIASQVAADKMKGLKLEVANTNAIATNKLNGVNHSRFFQHFYNVHLNIT